MAIQFKCNRCNLTLKVDDLHAGAKIRCPKCNAVALAPRQTACQADSQVAQSNADNDKSPSDGKKARLSKAWDLDTFEEIEPIRFLKKKANDDELDMTPMVDITFLLLIFFMVTAAFSLQKSLEVPTPDEDKAAQQQQIVDPQEENIVVRIDRDSTVWVNESEAPSEQDLLVKLRDAKHATAAGGDFQPVNSLLVMADGEARHEVVIMVLDAGNSLKMEPIRLLTTDEDYY